MNFKDKMTIICVVGIPFFLFTTAYGVMKELDKDNEIDIMDINNMCRPVENNYRICGVDSSKEFVIISLANGMKFKTDCKNNDYPYGINGTHFECNEISKTYDKFERMN